MVFSKSLYMCVYYLRLKDVICCFQYLQDVQYMFLLL